MPDRSVQEWDLPPGKETLDDHGHGAQSNHQEIVKFLLDKGVYIDIADYRGQTPLHLAIIGGHQDMVELLDVLQQEDPPLAPETALY